MSKLTELALLFWLRANDKGLDKYEILWLAEQQLERLYSIEGQKKPEVFI